jgi:GR25 family glycosyltransferase involved in LPS biosynthesis
MVIRSRRGRHAPWTSGMDCFYINLDSATERRARLESNFNAVKKPNWTLARFAAIDTDYIKQNEIRGTTSPGEKGCFLSHKFLIGQNLDREGPILIVEDDAAFGYRTCTLIDAILKQNETLDWDILFTDVCITNLKKMIDLLQYRRDMTAKKIDIAFMELIKMGFAGSTAYIVNAKSKKKLYDLLAVADVIDLPYDLYLRHLIHSSKLNGYSLFPFVTSLSEFSEDSQIKSAATDRPDIAWNMFRKMVWVERNLAKCKTGLESVKNRLSDAEMSAFKPLFAAPDEELNAFGILFSWVGASATM